MEQVEKEIRAAFGSQLRLRVSGICIHQKSILLVKHISLGKKGILWAPPGGGLRFGETVYEALKREFEEETGLLIEVGAPILINEYIESPLHAVELFFEVRQIGGELRKGSDPEMSSAAQIIQEVRFVSFDEIRASDEDIFHSLFKKYNQTEAFSSFLGFDQNIVFRG
jgi:8-oxo-dGTP diphosphatase